MHIKSQLGIVNVEGSRSLELAEATLKGIEVQGADVVETRVTVTGLPEITMAQPVVSHVFRWGWGWKKAFALDLLNAF